MRTINTVIYVGRNVPANVLIDIFNSIKLGNLGDVKVEKMDALDGSLLTSEKPMAMSDAFKPAEANGKS